MTKDQSSKPEPETFFECVEGKGLFFEEDVYLELNKFLDFWVNQNQELKYLSHEYKIIRNKTYRTNSIDKDFDGRFEIDFFLEPTDETKTFSFSESIIKNTYFQALIEAKWSSYDCFFFKKPEESEGIRSKQCGPTISSLSDEQESTFFVDTNKGAKLQVTSYKPVEYKKVDAVVQAEIEKDGKDFKYKEKDGKKKIKTPSMDDLMRRAVRQSIKNLQVFITRELETPPTEGVYRWLLPIIVTNSKLRVVGDKENLKDQTPEKILSGKAEPWVLFEFNDSLFCRGEKVSNNCNYTKVDHVQVWIVNINSLQKFLKEMRGSFNFPLPSYYNPKLQPLWESLI